MFLSLQQASARFFLFSQSQRLRIYEGPFCERLGEEKVRGKTTKQEEANRFVSLVSYVKPRGLPVCVLKST